MDAQFACVLTSRRKASNSPRFIKRFEFIHNPDTDLASKKAKIIMGDIKRKSAHIIKVR